jgi:hypothetical protein
LSSADARRRGPTRTGEETERRPASVPLSSADARRRGPTRTGEETERKVARVAHRRPVGGDLAGSERILMVR